MIDENRKKRLESAIEEYSEAIEELEGTIEKIKKYVRLSGESETEGDRATIKGIEIMLAKFTENKRLAEVELKKVTNY